MATGPLGPVAYATNSDVFGTSGYLRDPSSTGNANIMTTLLNAASRFIDEKCGRFFYDDGTYTRYFDILNPTREITLPIDFYPDAVNGVVVKLAFYENQPLSGWLTLTGDGKTPGATNFFLWPTNPKPYLATGQTTVFPYQGFNMPAIPMAGTNYIPTPRPGSSTVSVTAGFGFQKVPDVIKDLTIKLAVRAWKARQAGEAGSSGSPDVGAVNMSHHFDSRDESVLLESSLVRFAL